MAINPRQFRRAVVEPVCELLASRCGVPNTEVGRNLVIVTAACQTQLGTIMPSGGITRIDEATFRELWNGYIHEGQTFQPAAYTYVVGTAPDHSQLQWNLALAVMCTRLIYHRTRADREPPPQPPPEYLDHLHTCYNRVWSPTTTRDEFALYLPLTDVT